MSRRFIAAVLALSVTITGFAAIPARSAEAEQISKVLGTAATLFIIGTVISTAQERDRRDRQEHDDRDAYYPREVPLGYGREVSRHPGDQGNRDYQGQSPAFERDRYRHLLLPASCIREIHTRHDGIGRVFARSCVLERADIPRLPERCEVDFQTRKGRWSTGYQARCMRREGYRVAWNR